MGWVFELFDSSNTTRVGRLSAVLGASQTSSLDMEDTLHLELGYDDPLRDSIEVGSYVRLVFQSRTIEREIQDVDGTTLQLEVVPDEMKVYKLSGLSVSDADSDQITVSSTLPEHRYDGGFVQIDSGTGVGQKRTVGYNSEDTLYLMSSWTTTPDATSQISVWRDVCVYLRRGDTWLGAGRVTSSGNTTLTLSSLPSGYSHQAGDVVGLVNYTSYRIRKASQTRDSNGILKLVLECEHISYELLNQFLVSEDGREILDYSAGVTVSALLSRLEDLTDWSADWNELWDSATTRPLTFSAENLRRVLGVIHEEWGCDVRFNEDQTFDLGTFGRKGRVSVRFRQNMQTLTKEVESESDITTVWALGATGDWVNCASGLMSEISSAAHSTESTTLELPAGEVDHYHVGDIVYVLVDSESFIADSDSTSDTINYSSASWSSDQFAGGLLVNRSLPGRGEFRRIESNTSTSVSVYDGFHSDPVGMSFVVAPRAYLCTIQEVYSGLNRIIVSWDGRTIPEDESNITNGWVVACIRDTGSALTVGKHPLYRAFVNSVNSPVQFTVDPDDIGKFQKGDWVFIGQDQLTGVMRWVTDVQSFLTDVITVDREVSGLAAGWEVEKRGISLEETDDPVLGKFEDSSIRDPHVLYEKAVEWGQQQREKSIRYSVQLADLFGAFPRDYEDMEIQLGDYIRIVDSTLGIDSELRVVRMTFYPLRPWETEIEISNIQETSDRRRLSRIKQIRNTQRRLTYTRKLAQRRKCRNWKDGDCLVRNKLTSSGLGVFCYSTDSARDGAETAEGRPITTNECPYYTIASQNLNADAIEGAEEYSGLNSSSWTDIVAVDTGFLVKSAQVFLEGVYDPSTGYWLEEREYAEVRIKHQSDDTTLPIIPADTSTRHGFVIQARRLEGSSSLTLYIRWVASGDRT